MKKGNELSKQIVYTSHSCAIICLLGQTESGAKHLGQNMVQASCALGVQFFKDKRISVPKGCQTSPLLLDATKPTRIRRDSNLTHLKSSH